MSFNFKGGLEVGGKKLTGDEVGKVEEKLNTGDGEGKAVFNFNKPVEVGGEVHAGDKVVLGSDPKPQSMGGDTKAEIVYASLEQDELPAGAILDADLIHGENLINGQAYELWKPDAKSDGKFVYIPKS